MDALIRKLNPRRFNEMSPFMAAIVGYVLGESFTTPAIAETCSSATNAAGTPPPSSHPSPAPAEGTASTRRCTLRNC
jgi:hypothetical protein